MPKEKKIFVCSKCDGQFPRWSGRCEICGAWGTVAEQESTRVRSIQGSQNNSVKSAQSTSLSEIAKQEEQDRIQTGDLEIDRVLGGGIVHGSVVLLSGEPGIGKSTMVTSIAGSIAKKNSSVLYISGEESAAQLAARFNRLASPTEYVRFLEAFPIETIVATIEKEKPTLAIVDSIQTMRSSTLDSASGGPTMVRYATSLLLECAKRTGIPVLLIGQVTKDGSVAGPKTLEHLVDTVIQLEGDPVHAYRLLRSAKNRFGSTDEIGVFEMTGTGLKAVANPSERFLEERAAVPGSVITATMEGTRVFLVEVQALVDNTSFGNPARRASGFDQSRLQMLCAILNKRAGLKLGEKDVFVNVIGGLKLNEPAADLAVCAAIISAINNITPTTPTIYAGEVGLGGEVRSIPLLARRISEAERFGIERAVVGGKKIPKSNLNIVQINSVNQLK